MPIPLSLLVWSTYFLSASAVYDSLPGPDNPRTTPCSTAYRQLDTSTTNACDISSEVAQRQADSCPLGCQALLDSVAGNCTPGRDPYILARSVDIVYQEAVLYNELAVTTINPLPRSCNFYYTPTTCDLAVNTLSYSRSEDMWKIGPQWQTVGSVCEKSVNGDCSLDCQELIDAVVDSCDMPSNAMFAPRTGYGSVTHKQVEWRFPYSMEFMGFNPFARDVAGTLSSSCWNYYEEHVSERTGVALNITRAVPSVETLATSASSSHLAWRLPLFASLLVSLLY